MFGKATSSQTLSANKRLLGSSLSGDYQSVFHLHTSFPRDLRKEGGVRVCGIAVLGYFWCGVAVIFISKYGIAVFPDQAVCGEFKFYVAVLGEKIVMSR